MSKRITISVFVIILAGLGATFFLSREEKPPNMAAFSEEDLSKRRAQIAADAGQPDAPSQVILVPLDLSHPVRLAIGGLGLADNDKNQQLGDLVTTELTGTPGFNLVERQSLATILQELNLSLHSFVRAKDAVRVGKLLKADWFLLGTEAKINGTNSLVVRVVDARTGVMRDAGVFPADKPPVQLAAALAAFMRQTRQNAATAKLRVYLAVGAFEDLSVNNRQADFPTQLRGYLTAAYRGSSVTLLEREYVDTLLQEMRLDLAGLTEESESNLPPAMQSAFWLVTGQYQSYETTNLQVELNLHVWRVFGRSTQFTLRGLPGESVGQQAKAAIDDVMLKNPGSFSPTRRSEAHIQMKIGKELGGLKDDIMGLVWISGNWDMDSQVAAKEKRNLEEAMRAFEAALLLEPTNRLAKMYLAACLRKPANYHLEEARNYYREIIEEPVQDKWSELAQKALLVTFESYWWQGPEPGEKGKWFQSAANQTSNAVAAAFYNKQAQAAADEVTMNAGDSPSPKIEALAEQRLFAAMQSCRDVLQNKSGSFSSDFGMDNYVKIYGSNKGTAAQKLVELLPKMKERMPDLEPYLLAAVVTFQGNTNAPIITEFQRTLNDCIEHPEQVLNIVQFWNAIRWTVYDWCFEKTNYPLAVNLMEGERRVAAGGKVDFNNQEKIKLGYAYVVTERWQDALNLFESCSNQPVMMNGKGPWGCAFMPVLTDEAADYCRKKLGLEVAQDPRKFDMGEPLFCLCTPSAFAVEENGLWIAIGGQLLHLNFDLKTNLVVTLPVDSDTPISCMSLGSSNIWIGTYGQGLIEFDKASHQIRHLTGKDGLMMDDIASLRLAESTLWIGYGKRTYTYTGQGYSLGGGLGRLDLSTHQFTSYTLSLSDGPEVHRQTGGNIVPEASDKPTRRPVIAMAGGLAGDVWFVAENDPTRLHRYQARNNSWEATLWNCSSLASDNSRLFVGHYGSATGPLGVSVLDLKSNHWHELTAIGGLTPNAVSTFALDGRNLWVGGLGYIALLDVDQDKTIKFAHIKSSAVDRIQIAGGYVWAQFDWHLYRVPLSAVK